MWRCDYSEEWERRKAYLIRSLFEDLPILSPVPEAEESYNPSPSPILQPTAARPYSPLPPLIIEPEPNRHDEPESFYIQLEKKIKNYYKKLFIENRSETGSTFDGSDVRKAFDRDTRSIDRINISDDNIEVINEFNKETDSTRDVRIIELERSDSEGYSYNEGSFDSVEREDSIEAANFTQTDSSQYIEPEDRIEHLELNTNITRTVSIDCESQDKEAGARTSQTSSGPNYVQVTFEADVHKEPSEGTNEKAPSLVYDVEIGAWTENVHWLRRIDKKHQEAHTVETFDDLEESQVPDNINDMSDEEEKQDEIEAMRTPRNRPSVGSLENEPYNESNSSSINAEHRKRSLEVHTDSNTEEDIISAADYNVESSDSFEIPSSTPGCKENLGTKRRNDEKSLSEHGVVSASFSTPNKKKRNENVAVQTMCDEMPFNRRFLRDNFFIGTPKFFRLCSCENHTCNC